METTNIYILIDPRTNQVRYVGKANNISQRYRAHLNRARKHQIHKKNWIASLKKEGLKPIIEIVDVVPIDNWIYWETYWISQFKAWGFDLINYTNGGDGCTFGNQTSFKKGQGGKKVIGFNSEGIKVCEFDSMRQAADEFKTTSIWGALIGHRKTCKKLAWFYYDDIEHLNSDEKRQLILSKFIKIKKKLNSGSFYKGQKSKRSKKIEVENIETKEKEIFESGFLFATKIGVSQPTISWSIKNNKIIKKIYKIKFYD